uniref:Pyridine nucleotide-disulfide oxidoreductase n=1 Tax=Thermosporothrix sp. COM3 TaxID=2490863 RepID=A0A455SEV9_9CHLR|nr:pyridine nucleotide-disulfide oxidoreductase [Thermosporothrix sp. COM3]
MRKRMALLGLAAAGGVLLGRKWWQHRREEEAHVSQSEESYHQSGTRILILGAGFGGLSTALKLDQQFGPSDNVSILVVDRNNDMLFTPLLWTVASGRADPDNILIPIRAFQRGRHFHVLHAEVVGIDLENKRVHTSAGMRSYDIPVIALGSHTTMPHLPGLEEYAFPFHTPADALELRNRLIDCIEAAHRTSDPEEKQAFLTFVVGGAGDTGVELAAIIHDYVTSGLAREYPWLVNHPVRVIVAGRADRILPTSNPKIAQKTRQVLESEGIEIHTGTSVKAVTATTVETSHGTIPSHTLFWAAGTTAPNVVKELPVHHAHNGAVFVDQYLRIPTHPDVYVLGDSAWAYDSATGNPIPATAQAALHQGNYLGKAIATVIRGGQPEPYEFKMLGHLVLLGRQTGVARIGDVTLTGLPAWVVWHLVYLLRIPSMTKRLQLTLNWVLSAILGRETGQIRLQTGTPLHQKMLELQTT